MITVDYLGKGSENEYYYSYVVNSVFSVDSIITDFPAIALKKINQMKAQSLIHLYEQFRNLEKTITVSFPKIQTYDEALTRINAFITWGLENVSKEEEVLKYAKEMTSKLTTVVNEVPNTCAEKKILTFLLHCVTLTVEKRITI